MDLPCLFEEFFRGRLSVAPGGRVFALRGSSPALYLSLMLARSPFVFAADTEEEAIRLRRDISFFLALAGKDDDTLHFLPEPEGPDASGKRAAFALEFSKHISVAGSRAALAAPLWPADRIEELAVNLRYPGEFPREELEGRLLALGYREAPLVGQPGEFRFKAGILDIFPAAYDDPVRAEFFGDEIEQIRFFDVESQLAAAGREAKNVYILPAAEAAMPGGEVPDFSGHLKFSLESRSGFFPEETIVLSRLAARGAVEDGEGGEGGEGGEVDGGVLSLAGYGIMPEERDKSISAIPAVLGRLKELGDVLIVLSSEAQAERLNDLMWEGGSSAPFFKSPSEAASYEGRLRMTVGGLSAGFHIPGLFVLTEKELFGDRPSWRQPKKSKLQGLLKSLDDLRAGDYVVHADHGIGKFAGFFKESTDGRTTDLMVIEYAEGDKLYLPLYGIEKVHKYISPQAATGSRGTTVPEGTTAPGGTAGGKHPALDRLGGKLWQRKKERVKKRLKEMAGELLKVYAEREVAKGIAFSPDTELHREFDSFFTFEETPDQLRAVAEVKRDMESPRPMDRLLCGDVGYGKTEVAMRAAFKAVYDGKQVVVLVPTTLLCEQHFRTFSMRFSAFPVRIEYISRFKAFKERTATLAAFAAGGIDILIGTHGLLKTGMEGHFKNTGLLVVDEEHRFGVAHKERIKALKKNLDVLMLSATPIPRTLQMALSGIRDMSVLETPPEERLAVKTTVSVFGPSIIKEAIQKELGRAGQAFFVHNRIEDMAKMLEFLRGLLPQARIGIAHGRMPERELEKTMLAFMDGGLDILLATAIIGSGLDIPRANTLVVDRADMMGLADLYQLKGRVGRASEKAYAYFLIPGEDIITTEARKRLEALEELSYLGAGFRVAMKDLEIRGAGNMLGAEQSGYINDLGFDMYLDLLQKAVAELKGAPLEEKEAPVIDLKVNALIPEDYIEDVSLRLGFYRRIASASSPGELEKVAREFEERFGPPPEEARNLLNVMSLRIISERAGVALIKQFDGRVRFRLAPGASPRVEDLARAYKGRLKFQAGGFELTLHPGASLAGASLAASALREIARALEHLTAEKLSVIF